jgi:hypothetical protein
MPRTIKTPSFRTPSVHIPHRASVSSATRRKGLRQSMYKRASQVKNKLGNLYTNASFVLYSADQRKIYEAKQKYGRNYLIKLFPNYPKLVLEEFETVTHDNFNELRGPFVQKFQSNLPDIGETIRSFRELSLKNKRLKRYMDEDLSKIQTYLDEYNLGVIELEQNNEAYAQNAKMRMSRVINKQSASNVFFKGKRRNGTLLVNEQSGIGRRPLSIIQSYL